MNHPSMDLVHCTQRTALGVSILEGAGRMMVIGQSAGKSFMF